MARILTALAALWALSTMSVARADWPQWRGPERDGKIAAFKPPAKWPKELEQVWSVPVGLGHSSPILVGERVFVFTAEGEQEVLRAFNLSTGKELWKVAHAVSAGLDGAVGRYGNSPRSTPTASGGRVFTLGAAGAVTAVDAASGRPLWRRDFQKEFPVAFPEFGAAASPLVVDKSVIVPVGGKDGGALVALTAADGKTQWQLAGEGPGYASPAVWTVGKQKPQIVTQSQAHIVGVSLAGKALWKVPFETDYRQNIVSPVFAGDRFYTSGYNKPLTASKLGPSGLSPVWEVPEHPCYMSTPTLHGDLLFGMSHRDKGRIFCVDAKNGKVLWTSEPRTGENVSVQVAGDTLVLLNEHAELTFAKADGAGWKKLAEYKVGDEGTFAHPVLDGRWVLVKDHDKLTAWRWPE